MTTPNWALVETEDGGVRLVLGSNSPHVEVLRCRMSLISGPPRVAEQPESRVAVRRLPPEPKKDQTLSTFYKSHQPSSHHACCCATTALFPGPLRQSWLISRCPHLVYNHHLAYRRHARHPQHPCSINKGTAHPTPASFGFLSSSMR